MSPLMPLTLPMLLVPLWEHREVVHVNSSWVRKKIILAWSWSASCHRALHRISEWLNCSYLGAQGLLGHRSSVCSQGPAAVPLRQSQGVSKHCCCASEKCSSVLLLKDSLLKYVPSGDALEIWGWYTRIRCICQTVTSPFVHRMRCGRVLGAPLQADGWTQVGDPWAGAVTKRPMSISFPRRISACSVDIFLWSSGVKW